MKENGDFYGGRMNFGKMYTSACMVLISIIIVNSFVLSRAIAEENLIESVIIAKNRLDVRINPTLKKRFLRNDFFVEYDSDIDLSLLDYSIVIMPFIMNVMTIIWISGDTYFIESMDENLFHSLKKVKEVFKRMYPMTQWNGDLIARRLVKNTILKDQGIEDQGRVALLFSGGLDSTSSFFSYLDRKKLLIMAWGQYDTPLKDEELWEKRKKAVVEFASCYDSSCSFFRSNYHDFLNWNVLNRASPEIKNWRIGAVEGMGWAGLVAPILFTKKYTELVLSSSYTWDFPFPLGTNPFVDNNIVFGNVHCKHDQFEYARIDKACNIVEQCKKNNLERPFLKVCQRNASDDNNCCKCRKCYLTMLPLMIYGENPKDYGFNIEKKEVVDSAIQFISRSNLNNFTHYNFKKIREKLEEKMKKGDLIDYDLAQFLEVDFNEFTASDSEGRIAIDWRKLKDLAPEGVCLPKNLCTPENKPEWLIHSENSDIENIEL